MLLYLRRSGTGGDEAQRHPIFCNNQYMPLYTMKKNVFFTATAKISLSDVAELELSDVAELELSFGITHGDTVYVWLYIELHMTMVKLHRVERNSATRIY